MGSTSISAITYATFWQRSAAGTLGWSCLDVRMKAAKFISLLFFQQQNVISLLHCPGHIQGGFSVLLNKDTADSICEIVAGRYLGTAVLLPRSVFCSGL